MKYQVMILLVNIILSLLTWLHYQIKQIINEMAKDLHYYYYYYFITIINTIMKV